MLSPNTLERVSGSYRRGYYDGYYNKPKDAPNGGIARPFADYDYDQGYEAGASDANGDRNLVKRLRERKS